MSLAVLLLAAGQGARMQSKRQKILHEVGGKPMVMHVFETAVAIADKPLVVVVGPHETGVQALIGDQAHYVVQEERMGTGHATMVAAPLLRGHSEQLIVAYGDMPLLRPESLQRLAQTQAETKAVVVVLTVIGDTTSSFGRIIRDKDGRFLEIMEVAQAQRHPERQRLLAIDELNVGIYCFDAAWLWTNIEHLPLRQARSGQEYYLTDMVEMARHQGRFVEAVTALDPDECLGAGTRQELVDVEKAFRRRTNDYWLAHGVTLIDPKTIYIDQDARIGQDTIIWPNTYLQGHSMIGEDCVIGPNTIIRQAQVGDGCHIEQSVVERTFVAPGTRVPPFSHIWE